MAGHLLTFTSGKNRINPVSKLTHGLDIDRKLALKEL